MTTPMASAPKQLETKWTPGPWFANDHNAMAERMGEDASKWLGYAWVGFGGEPDGSFQGKLACLDRRKDASALFRERAAADARLIACAPEMAKALEWYGEQARLARLIHSEGDAGRHALQDDGGKRAAALLVKIGGDV